VIDIDAEGHELFDLPDNSVHLWFAFSDEWKDPTWMAPARHLLGDEEVRRLDRFHFPEHRDLYLLSHLLLRKTLSRYSHLPPNAWSFVSGRYGKPRLDEMGLTDPLCFNLSHSKGIAVVGVTRKRDIGTDVEQTSRRAKTEELGRRFFSAQEIAALEKLPPEHSRERFFLQWTLKEAYTKALGLGLLHPLHSFSIHLTGERPYRIGFSTEDPFEQKQWRFALISPRPQTVAALCVAFSEPKASVLSCYHALPSGEAGPLSGTPLGLSAGIVYEKEPWSFAERES
jgi:4'-phosphopantetheinyl transferase